MATSLSSAHLDAPALPTGQLALKAPPRLQPHEGSSGALMNAIPMLGSIGSIVLVTTMGSASGGRGYLIAAMFLFSTVGFVVVQIDRQRKQRSLQLTGARAAYFQHLVEVRQLIREAADQQRQSLTWRHPSPDALAAVAEERSRVWERTRDTDGFLEIRYGTGTRPLAIELVAPEEAATEPVDPASAAALQRLMAVHRLQYDLPASIDLSAIRQVEICGPAERARSIARSMICSAATFHSPDHLVVAVLTTEGQLADWDWIKWLPHALSPRRVDAVGPMRMVSTSLTDLADLLPDLSERPRLGADERAAIPHVVLVTDGVDLPPANHLVPPDGLHGLTVLDLPRRWGELTEPTRLRLQVAEEAIDDPQDPDPRRAPVLVLRMREAGERAYADLCSTVSAEALARRLTPLQRPQPGVVDGTTGDTTSAADLMALLGLGDVRRLDLATAWCHRPARDRLRVPIGVGEGGAPVHLDLKESAQGAWVRTAC